MSVLNGNLWGISRVCFPWHREGLSSSEGLRSFRNLKFMAKIKILFRILLGAFLLLAGIAHLVSPTEFLAQVPDWVPMDRYLIVILSGVVEMILGVALITLSKHRVMVGWVVAAFFVAIFPGNISQYINQVDAFGLDSDRARLFRLFFQPVFIGWALWATGAWTTCRQKQGD